MLRVKLNMTGWMNLNTLSHRITGVSTVGWGEERTPTQY